MESATAALTFTCAQQEPVDFGAFLVGAVVGEDDRDPVRSVSLYAETCEFSRSKDFAQSKIVLQKIVSNVVWGRGMW